MTSGVKGTIAPHGTLTRYTTHGCRCEPCTTAQAHYHGHHARSECIEPLGRNSRCGAIAGRLIAADAEVTRLARLANRSPSAFAKYRDQLAVAKATRDIERQARDEHMTECPGAADRFAS